MNKTTAIAAVLAVTPGRPVVFTTGYACRVARHLADRPGHFYMTGSMGLASSIGVGLARATGRPAVVVDGDGAFLMNPVGPLTAGTVPGLPLVHVLLDDGSYASTGGQATPRADLPALARACGYHQVMSTVDAAGLRSAVGTALAGGGGPVFVHAVLAGPDEPVPPRVELDLGGHARGFREFVVGGRR
ncbi:thiamine pyrophosphate-dependent enzyme [Amycolatopsis sp. PS_44_ISF1]|uniref:thiamine pyrophosphate-dependent enzyme n=1 Tax=Amycolatopsis sp. PS_44_ISF1 TaxID=2974917 RepID=UPI0028E0050B|nr:thiamine pyrophosphate-dependent enzyme [Amycolatopsis sp. PS_44_ISF1]MDT8914700.1 thiamine pyrophosphate-dependent enzyme [Amycolatopsis sp. PS_44_ISF1]